MRPVPAGAFFTNELLWWEFWLDASQCWGNRLRKKFWGSLDSMLGSMKEDIVIGRQAKATASAVYHVDLSDSSAENMSRMVRNGAHTVSLEELRKLCHEEQLDVALQTMSDLQRAGSCISRDLMCCLLQRCTDKKDIWAGRWLYSLMASIGLDSIACLGDHLIRLFAMCGSLPEANQMFDKISKPTSYSWNAIISANAKLGKSERAIELYQKMIDEGVCPDEFTFMGTMKACGAVGARKQGRVIHEEIIKCGLESEVFLGSTLIDMYAKCGSLEEGRKLFDILPCRNSVSWNAMIAGYAQHGNGSLAVELFEKMQQESVVPNKITFSSLLKACGDMQGLGRGMSFHNQVVGSGLDSDVTIGSTLVDMYAKCGSLEEGRKVFDALPGQSVVSWNAMIVGYAQHNKGLLALELYKKMLQQGLKADTVTYSAILKACSSLEAIEQGKCVHEQIVKSALEADVIIGNTLIDMYAKCGSLEEAQRVFDNLPTRNVVSWSAIIAGHAQNGNGHLALELFGRMQEEGIKPHKVLCSCISKVCGSIGAIEQARLIHDQVKARGFGSDLVVGNSLIDMYSKCECLEEGRRVFDELSHRDIVSWNTIIAGYAQDDASALSAFDLFEKMGLEGIQPNDVTYSSVLKACGSIGSVRQGRLIHDLIIRTGLEADTSFWSTLVDMYAKCGILVDAHDVLKRLKNRTAVLWNALITGYAQQGNCRMVGQCFKDMRQEGLKPDDRTYTSILAACSHGGHVEEGRHYFKSMIKDKIKPSSEHFNGMASLLGSAGRMKEAREVLQTLPMSANATFWRSLMTSSEKNGNEEVGEQSLNEAAKSAPDNAASYVLMSNIYADGDKWDEVRRINDMRIKARAWKKPGKAWVEIKSKVHEFIVGDKTHQESTYIYDKLRKMKRQMNDVGYVPNVDLILENRSFSDPFKPK